MTGACGKALYSLAREEGQAQPILVQLLVLERCFRAEPGFAALLSAPNIPKQERCAIVDRVLGREVHPYVRNFLKILTERCAARDFGGCVRVYEDLYNRDNGIQTAAVTSAHPLSAEQRRRLTDALSRATGKSIRLSCRTDPKILGGLRVELDGKQLDGTLRRRLEDLETHLRNDPKGGSAWNYDPKT